MDLKSLFPRGSKSFIEANAPLSPPSEPIKTPSSLSVGSGKAKRGRMNKTESEFSLILEAMKRKGEILRYEFEGITLRWADMRYTPDFFVFDRTLNWKCIEIKGAHIWDRDIVRFKGARAFWPEFAFELHQKTKQGWKQLK